MWLYEKPRKNKFVNQAELNYIEQDNDLAECQNREEAKEEKAIPFLKCFGYRQTWAFLVGKLMTDGVWWFFLFWLLHTSAISMAIHLTRLWVSHLSLHCISS